MAGTNDMVAAALELLPKAGEWMEFDDYKANLYNANPSKGRDVFAHIIKNDLALKKLDTNTEGRVVVMLSRLETADLRSVGGKR